MRVLAICVLLTAVTGAFANPAPMDMLTRAMTLHKGVKDYIADVTVQSDIPGVDIPRRTATVYVKPPDKTYVDSGGGFVIIPTRALLFGDIARDLEKEANVSLVGTRDSKDGPIHCVKITPKDAGDTARDARVLVWINGNRWTLEQVQVWEGDKRMVQVRFAYQQVRGVWMPSVVAGSVPGEVLGADKPGRLTMRFANYRLNTGLTDEFFKEKEQQSRGTRRPGRHRPR